MQQLLLPHAPTPTARPTARAEHSRHAPRSQEAGAVRDFQEAEFIGDLYRRHGAILLRFAARLLGGDWHRAEDVVQEAAIRAWQHAAELGFEAESVRSWLLTVVRNLAIDSYRARQARPPEIEEQEAMHVPTADGVDLALTTGIVIEAMRELEPYHREVLLHVHYVGRSVRETALMLGVPPGTVKSRTYYAMRALRETLRDRGIAV
ncbi:sigma-70 family RNA polymerase sigma factor [Streptomyces sp. NPDC086787]|uniref:sigma-70 family RNA polymerase sigma factor n=1 Tax=Streptomyces sp. NPDC086787 TaxID=3365759 RepID=UPI00380C878E